MLTYLLLIVLLLQSSSGLQSLRHATIVTQKKDLRLSYDFVIIGGGTSGLTVADRLTEHQETSVLVIEYGPLDQHEPAVVVPGLLNLTSSPYLFNLTSIPQLGLKNRTFSVPAAAVVGGGTVVNGMFFDRGAAADYDAWRELGNPGWGWDDILPYFKRSENFTPAAEKFAQDWNISWDVSVHGFGGPVQSSYPVFQWSYLKSFFDGWYSLGLTTPKDPGSGNKTGVFWAPSSLDPKDETRSYSRTAHYDRVIQSRPNYHLLPNNAGHKIVIEKGRAVGVTFIHRESLEVKTVRASKEVILAAGSIHSPQILQLSGIGSRVSLSRLGIEPVCDLPGVGQNFQDHPTLYPNYDFQSIPVPNVGTLTSNATYAADQLELYWSRRQGPYTIVTHGGNTVAFLSLRELTPDYERIIDFAASQRLSGLYIDSIDHTVMAGYTAQRSLILGLYNSTLSPVQEIKWNGETAMPLTLVKPLSRGSVSINSSDPLKPPVIDFGTLADPTDLETLIAALRINRALMASSPMQELSPVELSPGANLTTDAELRDALRSLLLPTFSHPCCTCPMMPKNLGGVVGPDLLVYGVESLSIIDASIMPLIPATHTSSTVYAIAEKAAVLIQERHALK